MLKKLATCALLSPAALSLSAAKADPGFAFPSSFFAFEDFGKMPFQSGTEAELIKTKNGYRIRMVMCGFEKKDIKIHLDDKNILKISAEHKENKEKEGEVMYSSMNSERKVHQAFQLSAHVDPATIKASLDNGILLITMNADPKKSAAQEIKIN